MKCNNQATGSTVQARGNLTPSRTPLEQFFGPCGYLGSSTGVSNKLTLDTPRFTACLDPVRNNPNDYTHKIWLHDDDIEVRRFTGLPASSTVAVGGFLGKGWGIE